MAHRFERSTTISAPRERVFTMALDVDFHRESFAETDEQIVGGISSGSMALGDTVTWRAKHFGIWWTMTSTISEYQEPSLFVDEQVSGPFKAFRHEHSFESLPNGQTQMVDIVEFEAPFGPLGIIAERLVLRRHLEALIDLRNEQLKQALDPSQ